MRFQAFQTQKRRALNDACQEKAQPDIAPEQKNPLVLAYIGDAYFSLYVRTQMIQYETSKVQILHTLDAEIVSAAMQAEACMELEHDLDEKEKAVLRRGRNAKSNVPKSATVAQYRYSTAFEALLGYWYIQGNKERLDAMCARAFQIILKKMQQKHNGGD